MGRESMMFQRAWFGSSFLLRQHQWHTGEARQHMIPHGSFTCGVLRRAKVGTGVGGQWRRWTAFCGLSAVHSVLDGDR